MDQTFWNDKRIAGSLLAASFLILLLALIIWITSGAIRGFLASQGQGSLAQMAPYVNITRLLILSFMVAWIVQLLGFGLLTRLLLRAGGPQLAVLAFTLILVATILAIVNLAFRMNIQLWAAQETARTGSLPAVYELLRAWPSSLFDIAERAYYLAVAGIGLGILRTGLLARWVGWAAIGWNLLWLIGSLGGGTPDAMPLVMPVVIGIVLLLGGRRRHHWQKITEV